MNYKHKYNKYKTKYLINKKLIGGMRTFSNDDKVYSVDMMFMYIKDYVAVGYESINVDSLVHNFNFDGWTQNGDKIRPIDVHILYII